MSGAPKVRSLNVADSQARPVLVPGGNQARSVAADQKPASKALNKTESPEVATAENMKKKKKVASPIADLPLIRSSLSAPSVLRKHDWLLQSNLSMNASCSSDASTDSFCSQASTGRIGSRTNLMNNRKQSIPRTGKIVAKAEKNTPDDVAMPIPDLGHGKSKCAWVTANTGDFRWIAQRLLML